MLLSYLPIYKIALSLRSLLSQADLQISIRHGTIYADDQETFSGLLEAIQRECPNYGLTHTADIAKCVVGRPPKSYIAMFHELTSLDDSLGIELEKEALFRIPQERKRYFEQNDLFGSEVAVAFPSCERDIRKAGDCYALGQEDGCVHHLMLVLERGLYALGAKIGFASHNPNWQVVLDEIAKHMKPLPKGPEKDSYAAMHAQFGFLKDAYRNHSAHSRDNPLDMDKALSILNHVRSFMQALEKGGLKE